MQRARMHRLRCAWHFSSFREWDAAASFGAPTRFEFQKSPKFADLHHLPPHKASALPSRAFVDPSATCDGCREDDGIKAFALSGLC